MSTVQATLSRKVPSERTCSFTVSARTTAAPKTPGLDAISRLATSQRQRSRILPLCRRIERLDRCVPFMAGALAPRDLEHSLVAEDVALVVADAVGMVGASGVFEVR